MTISLGDDPEPPLAIFRALAGKGQVHETLSRLVRLAAWTMGFPMSAIIATLPDRLEIIASHGIGFTRVSTSWSLAEAGYRPDETFVVPDTLDNPYMKKHPAVTGAPNLRALIRVAIISEGMPFYITLLVGDRKPHVMAKTSPQTAWPSARERDMLEEISELIRSEIRFITHVVRANDGQHQTNPSREQMILTTQTLRYPAALMDSQINCLAMNRLMAAYTYETAESNVGRHISAINVPAKEAMERLFIWALSGGEPVLDIEFVVDRDPERHVNFSVSCFPVALKGEPEPSLLVVIGDISARQSGIEQLEEVIAPFTAEPDITLAEPTITFLLETLVQKTAMRARRNVSYVSLRAWRKPIRGYQIKALTALKTNVPPGFAEKIAEEMHEAVNHMIGAANFGAIVPIPCGHSRRADCLSVQIANSLARRLGLPMVEAFAPAFKKGVSHPKENIHRKPLQLVTEVDCPVLLVDDVATSGRHLEEATLLLREKSKMVFPMAWICGDANDDIGQ